MKAEDSFSNVFNEMREEFNSSNNRMKRNVDSIFNNHFMDLFDSLDYFNCEYVVISKNDLKENVDNLTSKLNELKTMHVGKYQRKFDKLINELINTMCGFFNDKLKDKVTSKRMMSKDIKKILDGICDFDMMNLDEEIDNIVYNHKVDFEYNYINSEYCKDDYNKIIRSFKHSLVDNIRNEVTAMISEKQEIVSRHASKAYDIVDHYKVMKR